MSVTGRKSLKGIRCAAWTSVGPILPLRAAITFLVSVTLILVGLVLVDQVLLRAAEARGTLGSQTWQDENARINENNYLKNQATIALPIWSSKGIPLPPPEAKPGRPRILVLGDSFVWGDGYDNVNDTWWRQLDRELSRRGYDVEIVAAGMCGWATREEVKAASTLLPRYRPDLVIMGYVTNDADLGLVTLPATTPEEPVRGPLARLRWHLRQLRRKKTEAPSSDPWTASSYREWEAKLLGDGNLAKYRETVEQLAALLRSQRTPGFVVTLPNAPKAALYPPHYARVRPVFESAGLSFVDLFDGLVAFAGKYPTMSELDWGINPVNGHPGTMLANFFARSVADEIERRHGSMPVRRQLPATTLINDWLPWSLVLAGKVGKRWTFLYPPDDDPKMLRQPLGVPHVELSLEMPEQLARITVEGTDLEVARVYVTTVDPELGFDTRRLEPLTATTGAVSTIRVAARFKGPNRTITIGLVPK